jgi:hypothetical protein
VFIRTGFFHRSWRQNRVETDGFNPRDRWFESVFLQR